MSPVTFDALNLTNRCVLWTAGSSPQGWSVDVGCPTFRGTCTGCLTRMPKDPCSHIVLRAWQTRSTMSSATRWQKARRMSFLMCVIEACAFGSMSLDRTKTGLRTQLCTQMPYMTPRQSITCHRWPSQLAGSVHTLPYGCMLTSR